MGKILSGFIALLGIGLVALPTGIISSGYLEEISKGKKIFKGKMQRKYLYPSRKKKIPPRRKR